MHRTLCAALLTGVALIATGRFSGAVGQSVPPAPQTGDTGTAAISGVVSDAVTGRPIAGASVALYGRRPDAPQQAPQTWPFVVTDARGRFVFVNLSPTLRYLLRASRSGYSGGTYPVSGNTSARVGQDLPITMVDGEWLRDANIRMQRPGSISGRVLDERGEPVVGAAVRLFSRRLLAGHERLVPGPVTTTDDLGMYRMPYLQPGRYVVAVLSVQATVPATIPDGPRLLPVGGLVGRGSSESPGSRPEVRGASVDVDGRHRLVLTSFATPPPAGGGRPRLYAPLFYPNARSVGEALTVEIEPGMAGSDVDFQLVPVPAARVSGRVSGGGPDTAHMLLRLMALGTEHFGFGSEVATTLVETNGEFTFLNVPAGAYTLIASPAVADASSGSSQGRVPSAVGYSAAQGYSGGYPDAGIGVMLWRSGAGRDVWGRVPVSVGEGDITGIDVPMRRAATVRGRIVFDDPAPPAPNERFTVQLEPANGDLSLGVPFASTAAGDASHAFELSGVQGGRYVFRLQQFRGWRVRSVTVGGVDVTGAGVDGTLGRDYEGVVVTATKSGGELKGFVRDSNGRLAAGAAVMLFPADPRLWVDYGIVPDRLASTHAESDGTYSFTSVQDGDYLAVAVPPTQAGEWLSAKFLAAAAPHATRISLRTGAPRTQDLRVTEVVVK
jgi:protocatechuate 3,4-dioxygenase beta subunit